MGGLAILDSMVTAPDLNALRLLGPLLVAVQFVLFAFVGVALFSTILALAHAKFNPALGREFARVVPRQPALWVICGFLPLLVLPALYGQLLYGAPLRMLDSLLLVLPLGLIGLGALYNYRIGHSRLSGGLGVLATIGFVMPFVNLLEQINNPGLWPLTHPLLPDIYASRHLPSFAIFFVGGLLATGAATLFVHFAWPESRGDNPSPWLYWWGASLSLLGALLLPALVIWHYGALPPNAQSTPGALAAIPTVVVLWAVALGAAAMMLNRHRRGLVVMAVLAFGALALEHTRQHLVHRTAMGDRIALQWQRAEKDFASLVATQEAKYVVAALEPAAVQKLYEERCATCHAYDRKVVGPPHKDVLPKYSGDPARLAAFILNPGRVDPSYPPMVAPGLTKREADAVAKYLLAKYVDVPKEGAK
jgi:cytochrome c